MNPLALISSEALNPRLHIFHGKPHSPISRKAIAQSFTTHVVRKVALNVPDRSTQFSSSVTILVPRVFSLTQDRVIAKQVGVRPPPPRPPRSPRDAPDTYIIYRGLAITIFPAIFSSRNSHIDRDRGPRVESGRGHEGVAPRCATLCATLHQLRRFKGKCRRFVTRIVARLPGIFDPVIPDVPIRFSAKESRQR